MKVIHINKDVVVSPAKPLLKMNIMIHAYKIFDAGLQMNFVTLDAYTFEEIEDGTINSKRKIPTLTPMTKSISREELNSLYSTIELPQDFEGDFIEIEEYKFLELVKKAILEDEGGALFGVEKTDLLIKEHPLPI